MEHFYHSAEIRWIIAGTQQRDALHRWFTRNGELPVMKKHATDAATPPQTAFVREEPMRVDWYLRIPDCDSVGIKHREGRLEVKSIVAGPRPYTHGSIVGRIDQWVKWSLEPSVTPPSALEDDLQRSGPWTRIEKIRFLQKYSSDTGHPLPVSPDSRPDAGCNIEVTHLKVDALNPWTTFGFEAFGEPARLDVILDEAVGYYFDAHGPPIFDLDPRDCLSYPAWLALMLSRETV
jgi:hypothetical protein